MKVTVFLCSLALVFSVVGVAGAVPTTWEASQNFNEFIGSRDSFSFALDIEGAGFRSVSMGGDDIVDSYSLTVALHDDGGRRDYGEIALIDQAGVFGDGFYNFHYVSQEYGWSFGGRASLNYSGILNVSVRSWGGDFFLDRSGIVARGDNGFGNSGDNGSGNGSGVAPVPEPSTILLMGAGLLGLVAVGRRKFNRKG